MRSPIKLHSKPSEVQFSITRNPTGSLKAGSPSFKALKNRLHQNGRSSTFHLGQAEANQGSYLVGREYGEKIEGAEIPAELAFVILETDSGHLELILGFNHEDAAEGAIEVKGVGDIYHTHYPLLGASYISKITDQSGGYYVPNTDPHVEAKKASARAAMHAVGLPMNKFKPFAADTARPLVFSKSLNTSFIPTRFLEETPTLARSPLKALEV